MIFLIIVSIYCLLIIALAFGFARLEEIAGDGAFSNSISVIVAVRDEDKLNNLLDDLSKIQYPKERWELIVVDDHSAMPPACQYISNKGIGKKAAITTGIASAKGDIIVTTDGDCRVDPRWLAAINSAFQKPGVKMVVGGVRIEEDRTFFSKLQALEFVSVSVTGAATIGLGFPTMSNGANLSFRKDAFYEVGGYQGNENIPSGDDEFLMNKFDPNSIIFLNSKSSVVSTTASRSIDEFVQQRLRWAGKWKTNTSLATKLFAVAIFLFHVSFVVITIGALMGSELFRWLLMAKVFVEAILLIPAASFFGTRWRWIPFFVLQLVYPVYVISIGLLSQVVLPKWKGRAVEAKV